MRRFTAITAVTTAAILALIAAPPVQAAALTSDGCHYQVKPPYPANLWIRSGPGSDYDVVDWAGYEETIWGSCQSNGSWVRVGSEAGVPGWAYRPYLRRVGG